MKRIKYFMIILLGASFLFHGCNDKNIKRQKEAYENKLATKSQTYSEPENIEVEYSTEVIELNDANFNSYIANGVTLVDFWAVWCRPCKIQGPIVDQVALELGDSAYICKLNVDSNTYVPQRFAISSIPTIIVFKDGVAVKQLVGVKTKLELINLVRTYL